VKMLRFVSLLSMTLLFAAMSQAAIFSDGFEAGMGNWTQYQGVHPQVCVAGGHSGGYMSAQSPSDSYANTSIMEHNLESSMTNVVVTCWVKWGLQLDCKFDPAGGTNYVNLAKPNYIQARNPSPSSFARFMNVANPAVSGDNRTNYLAWRTISASGDHQVVTNIVLHSNQWYEAKFVFDANTGVKGYWDGQLIFTDAAQTLVRQLRFGTEAPGWYAYADKGYMNMDDVSVINISDIPEPTTCQEVWQMGLGLAGDFNEDCRVDFKDLAIFCEAWLQ
jgi:hypothetical protein